MTPTSVMTPKLWFRPNMEITIVLFCILFTNLIVNTKQEHYPIIISVTLLYWSFLVKEKCIIMLKNQIHSENFVRLYNTQLNHIRRYSIWKLYHFELHRKALLLSYLSFTAWWLNQKDNNNNNNYMCVVA